MSYLRKYLGIAALLAAVLAAGLYTTGALAQVTDTYDAIPAGAVGIDGMPDCLDFSGTDPSDGALTISIPPSFTPRYAMWVDNASDGGAPVFYFWTRGMTTATVQMPGGSTAFSMNGAVDTDAGTAGSFIIDADATTDDAAYFGVICR